MTRPWSASTLASAPVCPPHLRFLELTDEIPHGVALVELEHVWHVLDDKPRGETRRRAAVSNNLKTWWTSPDASPLIPAVRPACERSVHGKPAATTCTCGSPRRSATSGAISERPRCRTASRGQPEPAPRIRTAARSRSHPLART